MSPPPSSKSRQALGASARGVGLLKELTEIQETGRPLSIPLSSIDLADTTFKTRLDLGEKEVESLKASIQRDGLINPIIVKKSKKENLFTPICGFRRIEAVRRLNEDSIQAIVVEANDEKAYRIASAENLQRKDLTDLEWALQCFKLTRVLGKSYPEVHQLLGFSPKKIQRLNRLASLTDKVKDALGKDLINSAIALQLARVANQREQDNLLTKAIQNKWIASRVAEEVSNIVGKKVTNSSTQFPSLPTFVSVSPKRILINLDTSQDQLVSAIEGLLDLVKQKKLVATKVGS